MTADSFETAVNTRPVSIFQSNGLGPMRSTSMAPPIDELIKVTDAGKHGPLYGMTLNAIYKFSTKPVRPASLLCEPSRVPLTVLSSITYDTNRQRIIAWGTTEEAPAICAYSTRTHTWSTLRRLTHRDIRLADIVYDPKKDRLFGLAATMEDSQPSYSKVLEMTPNGQVLKSITLSSPTEGGVWQNHVALHVKDDLLVIFSPQIYDPNDSRLPVPAKVYVYQLSSGRLIWKGRREPQ